MKKLDMASAAKAAEKYNPTLAVLDEKLGKFTNGVWVLLSLLLLVTPSDMRHPSQSSPDRQSSSSQRNHRYDL